ncbi:hypothetical protein EBT31_15910 [bacterium]|nr:hypothetical protein [bacterium]
MYALRATVVDVEGPGVKKSNDFRTTRPDLVRNITVIQRFLSRSDIFFFEHDMTTVVPLTSPPPLRQAIPTTFNTVMTTALTTVAAMSWTDAFRSMFQPQGFFAKHAVLGPWVVAVLATIMVVFGVRGLYSITAATTTPTITPSTATPTPFFFPNPEKNIDTEYI